MRARWLGVFVTAWGLAGAGCNGSKSSPPAPSDSAPVLRASWLPDLRYDYKAQLVTTTRLSTQAQKDLTVELKGSLQISVLAVEGQRVELAFVLDRAELHSKGEVEDPQLGAIAKELAQPAWFELTDGVVSKQGFARGLSAPAVSALRTLASAFQLPGTPASAGSVTVSELDGTGRYQAKYERDAKAPVLLKSKLHFDELLVAGQIQAADRARLVPKVLSSSYRLSFGSAGLRSIRGGDELESSLMGAVLRTNSQLELELERPPARPQAPLVRAQVRAAVAEIAPSAAYGVAPTRDSFDAMRWDGRSFEALLAALEKQARQPTGAELVASANGVPRSEAEQAAAKARLARDLVAFSSLVALLRQKPETLASLERAVLAKSGAAAGLLDALGSVGTPAAQALLVKLVLGDKLPRQLLGSAATSLIRSEHPTAETLAALESMTTHPVLADFGVYGLGTAARKLREAGDVTRADDLARRLVSGLNAATNEPAKVRFLRGLANSGSPQVLDAVKPLLKDPDEQLRSAALEALRLVQAPAVDQLTAELMQRDERGSVRATALRVAAARPPSDTLDAAVGAVSLKDSDAAVRQQAVELLARWLPQRETLRSRLQEVASKESQPRIREVALAALKKAG